MVRRQPSWRDGILFRIVTDVDAGFCSDTEMRLNMLECALVRMRDRPIQRKVVMRNPVVIIGAGGFGREVFDVIRAINQAGTVEAIEFLGFIDDGNVDTERLDRLGAKHLGGSEMLTGLPAGTRYVIGIGNGTVRRKVDAKATSAGLEPIALVHPDATIGDDVTLDVGVIVTAGVRITTNVQVGRHVHLNLNVTVGHDAELGDYSTVNPTVAVSGEVILGEECTVGTLSSINQGLKIGARSFVAAGSAVTREVESGVLVAGVPAVFKKRLD